MTTRTTTLAVGARIRHHSVAHTMTAIAGSLVTLRSERGRVWVTDARELLADEVTVVGADPGSEAAPEGVGELFANLGAGGGDEIAGRVALLNEVLTGYRSGSADLAAPGEPRAAFRPELAMSERQRSKADELGVGVRTLQRWLAAFQIDGPAGLADGRHLRQTDPLRGLDQRWIDTCRSVLDEHLDASRPSRKPLPGTGHGPCGAGLRRRRRPRPRSDTRLRGTGRADPRHQRLQRSHQAQALDRQAPARLQPTRRRLDRVRPNTNRLVYPHGGLGAFPALLVWVGLVIVWAVASLWLLGLSTTAQPVGRTNPRSDGSDVRLGRRQLGSDPWRGWAADKGSRLRSRSGRRKCQSNGVEQALGQRSVGLVAGVVAQMPQEVSDAEQTAITSAAPLDPSDPPPLVVITEPFQQCGKLLVERWSRTLDLVVGPADQAVLHLLVPRHRLPPKRTTPSRPTLPDEPTSASRAVPSTRRPWHRNCGRPQGAQEARNSPHRERPTTTAGHRRREPSLSTGSPRAWLRYGATPG